jgi:hypothetical protein
MPLSPRHSRYAADPTARGYPRRPNPPPSGVQKEAPEISSIAADQTRRYTPETERLRSIPSLDRPSTLRRSPPEGPQQTAYSRSHGSPSVLGDRAGLKGCAACPGKAGCGP